MDSTNSSSRPIPPNLMVQSVYNIAEGTVTSTLTEGGSPRNDKPPIFRSKSRTFADGEKVVDFVLVWDSLLPSCIESTAFAKREFYEKKLSEEGLDMEVVHSNDGTLKFIKIHAPFQLLRTYAEILKLRMPMRKVRLIERQTSGIQALWQSFSSVSNRVFEKFIYPDKKIFPDRRKRFTAIYSRDKEYLFDVESEHFFTQAVRSRIVQFILDRCFFAEPTSSDMFLFGIERLLNEGVYSAAYPLHDGDLVEEGSLRGRLYSEWASVKKWYRYQPVDHIREYFGVKIGLYFVWLGFYTHMLLPAAVVGLLCFIYSFITLNQYQPSDDVCGKDLDIKMCPLCDNFCDYWDLSDTCLHSKVTYLFDNYTTPAFAVFMSVWAVTFLELWKRYSAEITHRWDLTGWDKREEQPRPQYLARLEHMKSSAKPKVNVVTGVLERRVPFWTRKFPATILSMSIVLLLMMLALAAVIGVVLYRMSILAALTVYGGAEISSYAILFTTATAACINLVSIIIFNSVYNWLAGYLTEMEMHRTQTEFDDSLTLKMYLLEFVNYYASIFYIAFCKGKLVGHPASYNRLFGYRQEECGPGGCLMELCIQLSIIMVGKQAMNTVLEMILPLVYSWWRSRSSKRVTLDEDVPQWEKDYQLNEWGHHALFPEYLEMVLQYGFVTIFVSAFPLAPLFALVNNILEMRLDAKKLLIFHRRPVAQRVRSIGVWFKILDSISKLAVVTNGLIIAFTSNFIPRLIYILTVSEDHSLNGFLNSSLAFADTDHLDLPHKPFSYKKIQYCRYSDWREPPWSSKKYELSPFYWRVLVARLAFVVLFENVVLLCVLVVGWCIPDVPGRLKEQIRREAFITNEIIIHQEAARRREKSMEQKDCTSSDDFKQSNASAIKELDNKHNERRGSTMKNNEKKIKKSEHKNENNYQQKKNIPIDWSKRPKDEALVHRPPNYGEILEVTV